ncbi:hypothetical protein [Mycobacterium montefiorense]|uniref:hypothetical protein n=1 Tax=Mycobacterium montefiorense TaxID=154654 RepID=UPI0021F36910|nr:hypothetical protein [Mycobacterium montefiorense]MCV7425469.1 hypothetical protein [Mycobacterium montefiorense]
MFYLVDAVVTFIGDIGQIVLEAHHTVVGGGVCVLLDAVLLGNLSGLIFALTVSVAQIVHSTAPLFGERPRLGVTE